MSDQAPEAGLPDWVAERVRTGAFATESEVLEAARRALEAVELLDPVALRSELHAMRGEEAEQLRAELQEALDQLDTGEGVPAPLAEIVLWETRLSDEERATLERLRMDAARVAAEVEVDDSTELRGPAEIIERLLREHVTARLVPPEFAAAVADRLRSGRYNTVEHVLFAALGGLELMEEDPTLWRERLRRMLAVADEQLERGQVVDGEEVFRQLRRQTVLRELLDGARE